MTNAQTTYAEARTAHPLRVYRVAAGLTQEELARRAGVQGLTVSRIETWKHAPMRRTVRKLAAVLGVEPAVLVPAKKSERPATNPDARELRQDGADNAAG